MSKFTVKHAATGLIPFFAFLPSLPLASDNVLDAVVITGTRSEKPLIEAPVRTELITKAMLERYHAQDLAQALRVIPGLQIRKIHGKAGDELQIQGLDGDRVLILIDGEPVSASTGSTVDLTQIGTVNVQRIEVIKGAVSALYGSAAMGGVVNVITETPDAESLTLGARIGHYADGNQSEPNERQLTLNGNRLLAQWRTVFDADFRNSGGLDYDTRSIDFSDYRGDRIHLGVRASRTFANGQSLRFGIKRFVEDLDRPYSTFAPGQGSIAKTKNQDTTRDTLSGQWHLSAHHRLQMQVERLQDDTEQDVDSTRYVDQSRSATHQKNVIAWHGQKDWQADHALSFGIEANASSLEQIQILRTASSETVIEELSPDADRNAQEVYLQDNFFQSEALEWVFGFRAQNDSDFGSHFAPRFNLLFTPELNSAYDYQMRFGLGQGYRVPNLKERFYVFDHSINGYKVLGNPDLTPESSVSLQLGFSLINSDLWQWDINAFLNELDDMISTDRAGSEGNVALYRYLNIDKARTRGIELSTRRRWSDRLSSTLAYNYLEAINKNTGKTLIDRPEHSLNLSLDWTVQDNTQFSLLGRYEKGGYSDSDNTETLPSWGTLDLKLNHQMSQNLRAYVGIDNATDVRRPSNAQGRDPRPISGRYFYSGIKYQW